MFGGSGGVSLLLGVEGSQLVLALAALQLGQGARAARTWERERHTSYFYLILTTKAHLRDLRIEVERGCCFPESHSLKKAQ